MNNKKIIIILLCNLRGLLFSQSITESDWQTAFNENVTHGQMEYSTIHGRVDILTDNNAIEVDYVRNYLQGIDQVLQYSTETGRKPGIALIIDGPEDSFQSLIQAKLLCNKQNIKFWLVNEYVSVSELISRKRLIVQPSQPSENTTLEILFPNERPSNKTATPRKSINSFHDDSKPSNPQQIQGEYWLNIKSGVRHNKSCRWYGNTKNGRPCGPDEGRACGQCGG